MKHLKDYLKKYRLESILAPLLKMLEACFDLAVPLIVADIIDTGIANGDSSYIVRRFFLLVAMALLGLASSFTAQFFAAKAAIGTSSALRHDLLKKIQSLSLKETDKLTSSTLITRMTSDVMQVQNGLNLFLRLFMRSPFIVIGSTVLAFTISKSLAWVFVAAIVLLFIIVFSVMKITYPMYENVQKNLDKITEVTGENLTGARVIRAFSREEKQTETFNNANAKLYNSQVRVGKAAAVLNPMTYVVVNTVIILVLWIGAKRTDSGLLLSGDIIALINYISQILIELVKLANLITQLGRSVACMNRIGRVLDTECSMEYKSSYTKKDTREAVRFENVSFRYSNAGGDALRNISFSALKGQTIGVTGGTGCGKSTLAALMLRFYDAGSGTVYIDGTDIKDIPKEKLVHLVSAVLQKPFLFKGTIKSNMLLADQNATDDEIYAALEIAQAKDFICEKPQKLDHIVEQDGANLSGGQKQRLTIARALLSKAEILILDDSFSALDFATDAALRAALRSLPKNITVFIISQRVSSIKNADRILVLDDGALVGNGTHEELLKNCGVYREIYESQNKSEAK